MTDNDNIHLIDIEQELNNLWEKNLNKNKIKACLFNLIVYITQETRVEYFKEIITKIIYNFPCRVLLIEKVTNGKKNYLDLSVTTEMHTTDGIEIGCDQIIVKVSNDLIGRVPFIITPHLVPDMPVYLISGKDPTVETDLLPYFQKFVSRIIFDNDCAGDLQKFSESMLHKLDTLNTEIMDMHWALIRPWRDVTAQVFNNPERIRQLSTANTIKIVYNAANSEFVNHLETQAIYFQGWLAAQFGWHMEHLSKDEDLIHLHYLKDKKKIKIELCRDQNPNLQCGSLLNMQVETADWMFFDLVRHEAVQKIIVHISTSDQCFLPFTLSLPNFKSSSGFMREIFYEKTSEHYRNMLKKITETNWQQVYGK